MNHCTKQLDPYWDDATSHYIFGSKISMPPLSGNWQWGNMIGLVYNSIKEAVYGPDSA